jgi:hypothetical protein
MARPEPSAPQKPSYSTSRRFLWLNLGGAWLVILGLAAGAVTGEAQAVSMATVVVPSMVALICGLLGVHRFAGAMDLRALMGADAAKAASPEGGA